MPAYCPVCARYSDKFPSDKARDDHLLSVHPDSDEAKQLVERRRKGFAQSAEVGKVTPSS